MSAQWNTPWVCHWSDASQQLLKKSPSTMCCLRKNNHENVVIQGTPSRKVKAKNLLAMLCKHTSVHEVTGVTNWSMRSCPPLYLRNTTLALWGFFFLAGSTTLAYGVGLLCDCRGLLENVVSKFFNYFSLCSASALSLLVEWLNYTRELLWGKRFYQLGKARRLHVYT